MAVECKLQSETAQLKMAVKVSLTVCAAYYVQMYMLNHGSAGTV